MHWKYVVRDAQRLTEPDCHVSHTSQAPGSVVPGQEGSGPNVLTWCCLLQRAVIICVFLTGQRAHNVRGHVYLSYNYVPSIACPEGAWMVGWTIGPKSLTLKKSLGAHLCDWVSSMVLVGFSSIKEFANIGPGGGDFYFGIPPAWWFCKATLWGILDILKFLNSFQNKSVKL